jgi:Protein kinase domain
VSGLALEPLAGGDPAEVAGYRLRGRLGAGGMGRVYLAFTPGGRPVALKVVRPELGDDLDFRARFRQEIAAARQVHGLFTAQVLDGDPDGTPAWLVTAYVAGPSLAQAVADHGPMPKASVFLLMAGVAEALAAIHGAGVVHRDLKPSNVLLAADGPRVIDFGIARALDATTVTRTGMRVGSPQFMAPEQVRGGAVPAAADVWALGALGAFAATGRAPFGEGDQEAVLYRVLHEHPDLEGCPAELLTVLKACLSKDPAQRPSPARVIEICRDQAAGKTLESAGSWLPSALAADLTRHAAPAPDLTRHAALGSPAPPAAGLAGLPTASAPGLPATEVPAAGRAAGLQAGPADPDAMPTTARTFPDAGGPPRPGWRGQPRTTVIAFAAAAALLIALVGYGAVVLATGGGHAQRPAAGRSSGPGRGARAAAGPKALASPSPSPSSTLDPCLFGTWKVTTEDFPGTISGDPVTYVGGVGEVQIFQPDGVNVIDFGKQTTWTTHLDGNTWTQIDTGQATVHYQVQNAMILSSSLSAHGTQALYENGSYSNGEPLTLNTEPDRYACSPNSLQIYAPTGGSVVLTREAPRAAGS